MKQLIRPIAFLIPILIFFTAGCNVLAPAATPTIAPAPTHTPIPEPTATPEWVLEGWELVWQDEFDGSEINADNWTFDIGDGTAEGIPGWGNNESQTYTDRPENARIEAGNLIIEAREEQFDNRDYTSARLLTKGLQDWQYGRIEARIDIPEGQGLWSAFWMLGANIDQVSWPTSGEIDVMENIGREPRVIHGTIHGPGYSGGDGIGGSRRLSGESYADNFHEFAIEWGPEAIRWFMDDSQYFAMTPDTVPGEWVYDQPFFILFNVAVGGEWPGYPDETSVFPQQMLVDYVRVYQRP
jgi:beta-glucanase (GH16 family)